jgi:hypothetical protein
MQILFLLLKRLFSEEVQNTITEEGMSNQSHLPIKRIRFLI